MASGGKKCRKVEEEAWSWPRHQEDEGFLKPKGGHMPDEGWWAVRAMGQTPAWAAGPYHPF